ncbi:MAG: glycosyltransferase family 61 protein [Hyphomicrobium sp.]
MSWVRPAKFLPGQLDLIRSTEFGPLPEVVKSLRGGYEVRQGSTMGYRLKNVDLVDGVLYSARAAKPLRARTRSWPAYKPPTDVISGALYESWIGNRWFGMWLTDDCLAYPLAEQHGAPVTTTLTTGGHVPKYEALLGLKPLRTNRAHFQELVIFDDSANNAHRKARGDQFRQRVISASPYSEHAGVFLLRGKTGDRRFLNNEMEIAEKCAVQRGFKILDPSFAPIEEIVAACAGARVIAGVEGSHLTHGLMLMPPESTFFVIQPPNRVVSALKITTDRQGRNFAFVVAEGMTEEFYVSWDNVDRTLDLAA